MKYDLWRYGQFPLEFLIKIIEIWPMTALGNFLYSSLSKSLKYDLWQLWGHFHYNSLSKSLKYDIWPMTVRGHFHTFLYILTYYLRRVIATTTRTFFLNTRAAHNYCINESWHTISKHISWSPSMPSWDVPIAVIWLMILMRNCEGKWPIAVIGHISMILIRNYTWNCP